MSFTACLSANPNRTTSPAQATSIRCFLEKLISILQLYDSILRCLQDVNSIHAHSASAMSITISMLIYHRCHSMTLKYLQSYIVRNAATLTINKRENTPLSTRVEDEQKQKKCCSAQTSHNNKMIVRNSIHNCFAILDFNWLLFGDDNVAHPIYLCIFQECVH